MTGERWPDKRARAVLFAGANKLAKQDPDVDPDAVAETGLRLRELLFMDEEVREDNADTKQNQVGYSADCMQFATLQAGGKGVHLGLWVGPDATQEAKKELGAVDDANPFRAHFGWVRIELAPDMDVSRLGHWVERARSHAREQKAEQGHATLS